MSTMKIDPDKIRDVIGKGGAVIRDLTEKSGASIDLDDDGTVRIYAASQDSGDMAKQMIYITAKQSRQHLRRNRGAYRDFGAFVTILPGKDGLVHISQISEERVEKVTDYPEEGQTVKVSIGRRRTWTHQTVDEGLGRGVIRRQKKPSLLLGFFVFGVSIESSLLDQ